VTTTSSLAPLYVRLMGKTIELTVLDEESRDRLAHQWARALVDAPDEPAVATIAATQGTSDTEQERDYTLTTQLTMAGLVATAGERLNLHAGGVADEQGRVLAVVGPSGAGKTTATRLLAGRLAYLSDETVSIAPDGVVSAHPKPLSVLVDPEQRQRKEQLSPDDLGLLPTPTNGTLARLVVLHRSPEVASRLVRLDTITGLLELIEQSSSLAQLPDPLRTMLRLMGACGGVWGLEYAEIGEQLDTLVELLRGDLPPLDLATGLSHHPGPEGESSDDFSIDLVARAPWVDAVEIGPDLVVLLDAKAFRLSDITATVWLELTRARTMDDLVAAAQSQHGDHPDAGAIVADAVRTLVELDLVTWGSLR
jgi:energy-coupling factor transporter ATP-binding protein EcfA2